MASRAAIEYRRHAGYICSMTTRQDHHIMKADVTAFFDEATNTVTYLLADPTGTACAIIDSVLDFDYASGRTDTRSADRTTVKTALSPLGVVTVVWRVPSAVTAIELGYTCRVSPSR